jgi:hypothetical protein
MALSMAAGRLYGRPPDESEHVMQATLEKLTPEEDGILRRLHCLERLGAQLAPPMRTLKDEIRRRDRRLEIREPEDRGVITPIWIT